MGRHVHGEDDSGGRVPVYAELGRELLAEAHALFGSALDVDATVTGLGRVLVPRLVDSCTVRLIAEDGTPQLAAVVHNDSAAVAQLRAVDQRLPMSAAERDAIAEALRTRRPIHRLENPDPPFVDGARTSECADSPCRLGLRSMTIMPLEARGRVLGVLTLATSRSRRELDAEGLALAKEIASCAALAIDNARLLENAHRARIAAESAAARLRLLLEASTALASSLDDETALRTLAQLAVPALADYSVAYACQEDGTIRRVGLAHRDPHKLALVEALDVAGPPSPTDTYGPGAVISTGEVNFVPEISEAELDRITDPQHARAVRALAPRSSIVVPLRARGRTVGALTLAATDESGRRYSEEDLALAEKLASRAALLVDNARLYRLAQEAVRARDDMVAAVSHDLRTPLHVIRHAAQILESDDLSRETRARTLEAIAQCTAQMERFVVGVLDVARLEAGAFPIERVPADARALLEDAALFVVPMAEEKSVSLTIERGDPVPVYVDADAVRRAIGNVLGNAVKFVPERGAVRASVSAEAGAVRVRIEDTGPGIPPEEIPRLFDRFWRSERRLGSGSGLGLAIAKGIVDLHGGEILVESTVGRGSTFVIVLPAAA